MVPRPQHYEFAHSFLPHLILRSWLRVRPSFVAGSAPERLRGMWDRLGEDLPEDQRLGGSEAISVDCVTVGGQPGYLIRMPPPVQPPEAAAALVVDGPDGARYFVLERSFSPVEQRGCWILGEWDAAGRHINYGECGEYPADGLDAMIRGVAAILEKPS